MVFFCRWCYSDAVVKAFMKLGERGQLGVLQGLTGQSIRDSWPVSSNIFNE